MTPALRRHLARLLRERSTDGTADAHVERLAPVVDAAIRDAQREAWDEGYGHLDANGYPEDNAQNPYRDALASPPTQPAPRSWCFCTDGESDGHIHQDGQRRVAPQPAEPHEMSLICPSCEWQIEDDFPDRPCALCGTPMEISA